MCLHAQSDDDVQNETKKQRNKETKTNRTPKVFMLNIFADFFTDSAKLLREALANQTSQHRPGIVVAHHPTNFIASRQMTVPFVRTMLSRNNDFKLSMHISGHTHIANSIRHPSGTLELTAHATFVCIINNIKD